MKTKIYIIVIIGILLTSCAPQRSAQQATSDAATEVFVTRVTMTPELVATQGSAATITPTRTPTNVPSKTPLSCVTLLTPLDGAEIPAAGRVTFSWSPMPGVAFYVLNIILPSGTSFSFETEQTFRNQYIEAFSPGGSYQWNVTAIGADRKQTRLCSSELATFSKPASAAPPQNDNDDRKKK